MWRRALWGLFGLILLGGCGASTSVPPPASSPPPGDPGEMPSLPDDALVVEEYRVALLPVAGLVPVRREQAPSLPAGAVAGWVGTGGRTQQISLTVERWPGADLEEVAELVAETVPLEQFRIVSREATRLQGLPALVQTVEGRYEGAPILVRQVIIDRDGWMFELSLASVTGRTGPDLVTDVLPALRLLPGRVEGPAATPPLQRADGPSWRVREGRFVSAASGVSVLPAGGWRLVVGADARQLNPEAEVGLHLPSHNAWAVVISEKAPPAHQDSLARYLRESGLAPSVRPTGRTVTLPLDAEPMEMAVARLGQLELLHGVRCHGQVCAQVLLWYPEAIGSAVLPQVREQPPTVAFVSEEERLALARQLAAEPHRQVGRDHALRDGVYRNFALGVTLRFPEAEVWRATGGTDARRTLEETPANLLVFEEPTRGLHGLLLSEPSGGMEEDAYHLASREAVGVTDGSAIREVALGDEIGRRSSGLFAMPFGRMELHVVTAVRGDRAVRLAVWGWPDHVRQSSRSLDQLLESMTLAPGGLPDVLQDGTRWTDLRFGYALELSGSDWTHDDRTPHTLRGIASIQSWQQGTRVLFVIAVALPDRGAPDDLLQTIVPRIARHHMNLQDLPDRGEATTVAGQPAERLTAESNAGAVAIWTLNVGRTTFVLFDLGAPEGSTPLADRFELVAWPR